MGAFNYDKDDLNNAILCVWKEARGDRHAAMNAVAHVIFNRVGAAGFAKTLHEVIYGKNQFSSMSVCTDPEYNEASRATLLQRLWQHKLKKCVARCAWRRSRERRD